jgi:hypothetical protein
MAPTMPASNDAEMKRRRELAEEVAKRFAAAETDLSRHRSRISDCYRHALPWRTGFNGETKDQLDDLFDSTAMTVLEDFAADMLNTFTPTKSDWLSVTPVEQFMESDKSAMKPDLEKHQRVVFSEMSRSNLYQALQEAYLDLGPGTMALCIQDRGPSRPIHCEAIPITELRIERGPWGMVNGRFRKRPAMTGEEVLVTWPKARLSDQARKSKKLDVVEALWRDWSDLGNESWKYTVVVGGEAAFERTDKGRGACAIVVARWSKDSTTAWGIGPTYRSLPDIKTLNHIKYLELKRLEYVVDPVTSYEDDGTMNVDNGVQPGDWLPRQTGSEPPQPIESEARFDISSLKADEIASNIRRAHYQDRPQQLGRTPPSATQWADEAAERARRMGTPATNLVVELQYPLFERFAWLLQKRGRLPKLTYQDKAVALQPISPLLRAQEQEEVVRMDRFAELITARFGPDLVPVIIKVLPYANRMAKRLGVDASLINSEAELQAAIQQLGPVLGGGGAGAPAPPTMGGPA